jgi:hypothetical protein
MGKNPIGPEGEPMERHHSGRLDGPTELIWKSVHDLIHESERDAVKGIFREDGLKGNPGAWTGRRIKSSS